MSATPETLIQALPPSEQTNPDLSLDRGGDLEAKQVQVAGLLKEVESDGLLILEPENFGWLSSGGMNRGILDPQALPALYFTAEGRWVICSNVDSQRLFDEELDEMGFQLKEWPWHLGREQLLADLCQGRTIACDQEREACKAVGERIRQLRRVRTVYEAACLRAVGQIVAHALEAACRTLSPGDSEREIAGQLSHRLVHRGALPLQVGVAADGRSRKYRQIGFTSTRVQNFCVLTATARKYGLCATASRAVFFGTPEPLFRQEHNVACRVSTTYLASTWPDAMPREILAAGRRVYQLSNAEHEWRLCPPGHITGFAPVELALLPDMEELFQPGWGVVWSPTVGAASSADTFLVTDKGPETITPSENWPLKRIRVQGADFYRPDLLSRE